MVIFYYMGWALLMTAFASAAAEVLVPSITGGTQMIISAHDLWYTLWPGGLVVAQIKVEGLSPMLWNSVILSTLVLPAWALLGVPSCTMIGIFRPKRPTDWRDLEEARKHEEQLLLYDELAHDARSQGMDRVGDDMRPDHSGHDALRDLEKENRLGPPPEDEFDQFIRDAGDEPKPKIVIDSTDMHSEAPLEADPPGEKS